MKGYKAFENNLSCLGYQYKLDKNHIFNDVPELCKKGFHFCTVLEDILKYYCDSNMRVFEIEANGIITEEEKECSKRACSEIKLIRELSLDELAQSITKSELAYKWAYHIGNHDIMIGKITDSHWAYLWARDIGDKDVMIDRVTESKWAYYWARDIGNQDIMIDRVMESKWAYYWALDIGNQDIMIDRVTESKWAYYWARDIGNQDIMIDRVTESEYAYEWAIDIGNQDVMIDRVTESKWAYLWAIDIGNQDVMINRITDSEYAYEWAFLYIDSKNNIIDKVIESHTIKLWLETWPEDKQYFIDKGLVT